MIERLKNGITNNTTMDKERNGATNDQIKRTLSLFKIK